MDWFGPGDARTSARGAWLFDQIVSLGTLVLKDLGGGRAGEIAAHRYLSSPYVTSQGVLTALGERTGEACAGRRVVAAQDTTDHFEVETYAWGVLPPELQQPDLAAGIADEMAWFRGAWQKVQDERAG